MFCQKCRARNDEDQKFCGECGVKLVPAPEPTLVEGDTGAFYCPKHPKKITRVRCGRCETPVCERCVVYGPAGTRCRACARHRVPLRPRAVAHEVGRGLSDAATSGRGFWFVSFWSAVIGLISNLFGGNDREL